MSIFVTIFYFILALFLLVTVHECGHFLAARLCGVKVLRFSFGFGPVLAHWYDKRGTEYAWSLVPLGGYIKMLDEEEGVVIDSEKHLAFNNKSVWSRIAIAFAGPLFNFIFAFVALWLVLVVGIQSLAPIIDSVKPGSIAARSGLKANQEIVALDNQLISSWHDFQYALMPLIGTESSVPMTVKSRTTHRLKKLSLNLDGWNVEGQRSDIWTSLGITPFVPKVPPIVGMVVEHSPASMAGFQVGDIVRFADGTVINDWIDLLTLVKNNPGKLMSIIVERQNKKISLPVEIGSVQRDGHSIGMLGVQSKRVDWPEGWMRLQRQGPVKALGTAFYQTVDLTKATFVLIGRLATGKVSLRGISGPVGIAQGAGESAQGGFSYYVSFLALISISLGVLNLLPIPLLDGGHLLYYVIELVRRRPLSVQIKSLGMTIGFVFLMALMALALTNDLSHLVNKF